MLYEVGNINIVNRPTATKLLDTIFDYLTLIAKEKKY